LLTNTLAHLHTNTLAHLHTCTLTHLHTNTLAHLHTYTLAHLLTCTLAHLLTCTLAHLHTNTLAHLHVKVPTKVKVKKTIIPGIQYTEFEDNEEDDVVHDTKSLYSTFLEHASKKMQHVARIVGIAHATRSKEVFDDDISMLNEHVESMLAEAMERHQDEKADAGDGFTPSHRSSGKRGKQAGEKR
jgi:hypothetical protein